MLTCITNEGDLWNARYWYRRIDILYDQARLWSQNLDNQLPEPPYDQTALWSQHPFR
ncbi:MAG: hypothetical protein AB4368_19315 [Xenococcaceae cyanobacterium]